MFQVMYRFLDAPVPLWLFIWGTFIIWLLDRDRTKWIRNIAQAVDNTDTDENGLCRHDPVSIREREPYTGLLKLLKPRRVNRRRTNSHGRKL